MMVQGRMSIQDNIDQLILPDQRGKPLSMTMSYRDKLKVGARKLLACDGGGIRGVATHKRIVIQSKSAVGAAQRNSACCKINLIGFPTIISLDRRRFLV